MKLENILIDPDGIIKVSDFGLSNLSRKYKDGPNLQHTTCGTINYIAPEVIKNSSYDGQSADLWSCGVILFYLLTGELPFEDDKVQKLLEKIVLGDFSFSGKKSISKGAKRLITGILDSNPRKRFTITEIKSDKWFKVDYEDDIDQYLEEEKIEYSEADDYSPITSILSPDRKRNDSDSELGFTEMYKRNFALTLEESEV